MPLINNVKQEVNAKIVYFGPAASGKGTNLNNIYKKLKSDCRGQMKTMSLQSDRMLFFDFVPPGQNLPNGFQLRFHIYTLVGKVNALSSWKMLLKGVDGIVFVADSDPSRSKENLHAKEQLLELLRATHSDVPVVIQYNKRDLEYPVSLQELDRLLNAEAHVSVPAVAIRNDGVLDSLSRLIRLVTNSLPGGSADEGAQDGRAEMSAPGSIADQKEVSSDGSAGAVTLGEPVLDGNLLSVPLTLDINGKSKKVTLHISVETE